MPLLQLPYPKTLILFMAFSYVSEIFPGYRERNNLSKLRLASWDFFFFSSRANLLLVLEEKLCT